MLENYRSWLTYERDAHARVVTSFDSVPGASRGLPACQQAIDLFAHMIRARHLWLFRLGGSDRGPEDVFPRGIALAAILAEAEPIYAGWERYLGTLEITALERTFEYRSLEGRRFRNRIGDILTQMFGHSWYHRGQIALLIRGLGGIPAVTDYVFWTREPLEG